MPLANSYVLRANLDKPESQYPLHIKVCGSCFLVQHNVIIPPEEMFAEYAYFSSVSEAWVEHARQYVLMARERFDIGPESKIIEIASNDGYLLRHFVEHGVPVLGVEPACNVADVARQAGIPTLAAFFSAETAEMLLARGDAADLIAANNVLAHAPDINDLFYGIKRLLKPHGVFTAEFPHLLRLMEGVKFDTIYHEHFFYFSLLAFELILNHHGLKVFDVQQLPTHGESLRVFSCHAENLAYSEEPGLLELRKIEKEAKLDQIESYLGFGSRVEIVKTSLQAFLKQAHDEAKSVVAFGAAAKGNTLLNYCGVGASQIEYVVDETPAKIGKYMPGSHLPIVTMDRICESHPDYIIILPWNHKTEIIKKLSFVRDWGAHFVIPLPKTSILD